jgi:hypothetical protein
MWVMKKNGRENAKVLLGRDYETPCAGISRVRLNKKSGLAKKRFLPQRPKETGFRRRSSPLE